MTDDSEYHYQQSAAIPYLVVGGEHRVVLITNSSRSAWIYPKGLIEEDMSPENSAAKEALEEAGVIGEPDDIVLDEYVYEKWAGVCSVKVYPLMVTDLLDDWDEKGMRERVVLEIDEAIRMVKSEQTTGLMRLKQFLASSD